MSGKERVVWILLLLFCVAVLGHGYLTYRWCWLTERRTTAIAISRADMAEGMARAARQQRDEALDKLERLRKTSAGELPPLWGADVVKERPDE